MYLLLITLLRGVTRLTYRSHFEQWHHWSDLLHLCLRARSYSPVPPHIFPFANLCSLMVLLGTANLSRAYGGCKGPTNGEFNVEDLNFSTIKNILFNLCKECQVKTMAAIPPSAFSAARIRETQRNQDMKLAKNNAKNNEFSKFFETTFAELSPLKYNSKLMNSIWGLYNRYSPHNVKKVNEAFVFNGELQPSAANSVNKTEPVINIPAGPLDNVWAAINVSQSH